MARYNPPAFFAALNFSDWPYDPSRVPWFPKSNDPELTDWFNVKLKSSAPVDTHSAAMVSLLFGSFGSNFNIGSDANSGFQDALYESRDGDPQGLIVGGGAADGYTVPYPTGILVPSSAGDSDRHVAIYDPFTNLQVQFGSTNLPFPNGSGQLSAGFSGAVDFSLGSSCLPNDIGGRGSGTSQFSGTIVPEDLSHFTETADGNGVGQARHALFWVVPGAVSTDPSLNYLSGADDHLANDFYAPATKTDGHGSVTGTNRPRMGMRLRLKATVDLSPIIDATEIHGTSGTYSVATFPGYRKLMLFVAVSLRDYGFIIGDKGGHTIKCAAPLPWVTWLGQADPFTTYIGPRLAAGTWNDLFRSTEWLAVWNSTNLEYVERSATRSDITMASGTPPMAPTSLSVQELSGAVTGSIVLPADVNRTQTLVRRRSNTPSGNDPGASPSFTTVLDNSSAGGGNTIGNTTVGGTRQNLLANEIKTILVTLDGNSFAALRLHIDGSGTAGSGSQVIRAVIYANNAGQWGARTAYGTEVTVNFGTAAGWINLPFSAPITPAAGQYHIGFHSGTTANVIRYGRFAPTGGQPGERFATDTYSDGATDPGVSSTQASNTMSMHVVTGSAGGGSGGGTLNFNENLTAGNYYYDGYAVGPGGSSRRSAGMYPLIVTVGGGGGGEPSAPTNLSLRENFADDTIDSAPNGWTSVTNSNLASGATHRVEMDGPTDKALVGRMQKQTSVVGFSARGFQTGFAFNNATSRVLKIKMAFVQEMAVVIYLTPTLLIGNPETAADYLNFGLYPASGGSFTVKRRVSSGSETTLGSSLTSLGTNPITAWIEINSTTVRARVDATGVNLGSGAGVAVTHNMPFTAGYFHAVFYPQSFAIGGHGRLSELAVMRKLPKNPVGLAPTIKTNGIEMTTTVPDTEDMVTTYFFRNLEDNDTVSGPTLPLLLPRPDPGSYTIEAWTENESPF